MTLPCMDCGTPRELDARTVELVGTMQALLKRLGDRPLADAELVRCDVCWQRWRAAQGERSRLELRAVQATLTRLGREIRSRPAVLDGCPRADPPGVEALFAACGENSWDTEGWERSQWGGEYLAFLADHLAARAVGPAQARRRRGEVPE